MVTNEMITYIVDLVLGFPVFGYCALAHLGKHLPSQPLHQNIKAQYCTDVRLPAFQAALKACWCLNQSQYSNPLALHTAIYATR